LFLPEDDPVGVETFKRWG